MRFLIGSGSIEDLLAKRRAEEAEAESPAPSEPEQPDPVEAEILIDVMTREEFLGEPDDVEFLQPKRTIRKASSKPTDVTPAEDDVVRFESEND